ncbi:hypothetical protein Fleli_2816 [Bernardetia litoralis DSM 6794]|uniref:RloB-like protein n=1 Tax=Bernardetia litoralis (strain ATCC 23117 / DSM 6794 / NBRC 15988 / NCIMB 1366 / Fx l1 / Sio-4) TaxID=880071 RepID=I4AMI4_BERLS|nr:DUF4276 family protein [Bernardetia litoralis]AFM05169.1 hypothetical protein Fleli_2816 [Bernardetia litoralis DSM 6794]
MNIYFLVEGKRTEKKVYPKWLSFLIPKLKRVNTHNQIENNNYYIFSANGFPSLLHNHLPNSVSDINEHSNFDYFVICIDGDDEGVENRRNEITDFMTENEIILNSETKIEIIVQNKCFETWFLGNPKLFKQNPQSESMKEFNQFYNVKTDDPELMEKPIDFDASTSIYHSKYLQEIFWERNINYSKNNPTEVIEEYFVNELIKRNEETGHLKSFKYFIDFCSKIRKETEK